MFQIFSEDIIFEYLALFLALINLEMILKRMLNKNLQSGAPRPALIKMKMSVRGAAFCIWVYDYLHCITHVKFLKITKCLFKLPL